MSANDDAKRRKRRAAVQKATNSDLDEPTTLEESLSNEDPESWTARVLLMLYEVDADQPGAVERVNELLMSNLDVERLRTFQSLLREILQAFVHDEADDQRRIKKALAVLVPTSLRVARAMEAISVAGGLPLMPAPKHAGPVDHADDPPRLYGIEHRQARLLAELAKIDIRFRGLLPAVVGAEVEKLTLGGVGRKSLGPARLLAKSLSQ